MITVSAVGDTGPTGCHEKTMAVLGTPPAASGCLLPSLMADMREWQWGNVFARTTANVWGSHVSHAKYQPAIGSCLSSTLLFPLLVFATDSSIGVYILLSNVFLLSPELSHQLSHKLSSEGYKDGAIC